MALPVPGEKRKAKQAAAEKAGTEAKEKAAAQKAEKKAAKTAAAKQEAKEERAAKKAKRAEEEAAKQTGKEETDSVERAAKKAKRAEEEAAATETAQTEARQKFWHKCKVKRAAQKEEEEDRARRAAGIPPKNLYAHRKYLPDGSWVPRKWLIEANEKERALGASQVVPGTRPKAPPPMPWLRLTLPPVPMLLRARR